MNLDLSIKRLGDRKILQYLSSGQGKISHKLPGLQSPFNTFGYILEMGKKEIRGSPVALSWGV
jgi:hypothetical protein